MADDNAKLRVLDHGFVRLVDVMGSDLSIVRNARVSYDAEWKAGEDEGGDSRLIRYLMKNGHNTPFEAVTFTFEIKAPIFVIRQWHRHRTQSYNELSARYRPLPEEYYVPDPHVIGTQSKDNKQVRDIKILTKEEIDTNKNIANMIDSQCFVAFKTYKALLDAGTPRELARLVLPVATYTHMFATMNLHNLFNFLRERLHTHAQWEIQQYARVMLDLVGVACPVATEAFINQNKDQIGQ